MVLVAFSSSVISEGNPAGSVISILFTFFFSLITHWNLKVGLFNFPSRLTLESQVYFASLWAGTTSSPGPFPRAWSSLLEAQGLEKMDKAMA